MTEKTFYEKQDPIIICRDVQKWYGDFYALRKVNMEVRL